MRNIIVVLLLLSAPLVSADWKLNNNCSVLNFISTKNSAVTEIHSFKQISGTLTDEGKAKLEIDLDSVETNIPIRNERMRQFLFETDKFSVAKVEVEINMDAIRKLKVGEIKRFDVNAKLSLHGITKDIPAGMNVFKGLNNTINVTTISPVILQTPPFNLDDGIAKLQELAKLKSILSSVPVFFSLQFDKQ